MDTQPSDLNIDNNHEDQVCSAENNLPDIQVNGKHLSNEALPEKDIENDNILDHSKLTGSSWKEELITELVPDPPDGGYGWIVALSSGVLSFMGMRYVHNK